MSLFLACDVAREALNNTNIFLDPVPKAFCTTSANSYGPP